MILKINEVCIMFSYVSAVPSHFSSFADRLSFASSHICNLSDLENKL